MLAYQKTYGDFCYDINHGQISNEIVKSLNRNFSESEKRSFKNSLRALKSALDIIAIPNDVQVGLEFIVPLTNKRIDFIIAGEDEQRNL